MDFYLSDYALSQPRASLTLKEFDRLKELQQQARDAAKAADDARMVMSVNSRNAQPGVWIGGAIT